MNKLTKIQFFAVLVLVFLFSFSLALASDPRVSFAKRVYPATPVVEKGKPATPGVPKQPVHPLGKEVPATPSNR